VIVACAVVHHDPPEVFLAEDIDTLQWVLALKLVAQTRAEGLGEGTAELLREALLNEQWGDAVLTWIHHTGTPVDVYPSFSLYEADRLPPEIAAVELQFTPLFQEPGQ
jgi:hypothetical protein